MFGISFSELLLIFIIGVIVFGPEQLPQIAKKAGKIFFSIQHMLTRIRQDIYHQTGLSELEKAKTDLNDIYIQIKKDISGYPSNINNMSLGQIPYTHKNHINYIYSYYQPELDFDRQPELFDQQ